MATEEMRRLAGHDTPEDDRPATTTPDSAELLLVAGPSGAGKTVFINQFRTGELAAELRSLLPAGAESWPQIGANDCMKRGVGLSGVLPKAWRSPGGVAHYDTAYIHRFGLTNYDEDPISELFRRATRLVVVSIMPPPEVLRAQFDRRQSTARGRKKLTHLIWKDRVRRPIERLVGRLKGVVAHETASLYDDSDWIRACHAAWDAHARHLVSLRPGSRLIILEPVEGHGDRHVFRIISAC